MPRSRGTTRLPPPYPSAGRATVDYGSLAARQAADAAAWEEAADHLERVLVALSHIDPETNTCPDQLEVLLELGRCTARAGDRTRALEVFRKAANLARAQDDPRALTEAVLGISGVAVTLLDVDAALIGALEQAIERLSGWTSSDRKLAALRLRAQSRLAIELVYSGDDGRRRALELTAHATAQARRLQQASGDAAALADALHARRIALWDPRYLRDRLSVSSDLITIGQQVGNPEAELEGRHWHFVDLLEAGDLDAARAELDAYAELASARRIPSWRWYVPLWRASLALLRGRLDESRQLLDQAIAEGEAAEDRNAPVYAVVGRIGRLRDLGEWDALRAHPIPPRMNAPNVPWAWRTGLAWIHALRHQHSAAAAILHNATADDCAALPWDMNRLDCCYELAEVAFIIADKPAALSLTRALEPFAQHTIISARAAHIYGPVAASLGLLAEVAGDQSTAVAHHTNALNTLRSWGAGPRAALGASDLARALRARATGDDLATAERLTIEATAQAQAFGCESVLRPRPDR